MGVLHHGGGGHRHPLLRLLAGTATAHPAAVVVGRLVPGGTSADGPDLPAALLQLALVVAIVGAVSFGDRLVMLLAQAVLAEAERRTRPRPGPRGAPRLPRVAGPARLRERFGPGTVVRRGPPAAVAR
ncbi:MAG: hypothetical protein AB7J32_14920 [Pseudonocardia sp.]